MDEASGLVALALVLVALAALTSCGLKTEIEKPEIWFPGKLTPGTTTHGGTIKVGDPYEVTFTVICPTNWVVDFPEIGREKEIVVLNWEWNEEPFKEGHKRITETLTLTSFRLGDHVICTKPIVYQHDGITETIFFPEEVLPVRTSLPDGASSEIADIKPSRKLPGRIPRWIWIVLGAAAAAFLTGLITSRAWKNREKIIPAAPPVPPHVIALAALQMLKEKGLLERDECNAFYTELSLILRTYLEGRFSLNAPDETTEEIVEEMSRSPELSGGQRNILQDFMRQADLVKFAKGHPDRTTMESAFDTTRQFVEETRTREHTDEN